MVIQIIDYARHGIFVEHQPHNNNRREVTPPDEKERISLDLHVGKSVKYPGNEQMHSTPKQINLGPNGCIRIETREYFRLPGNVFGQVCSRASLTAEGLVVANLKVDPKFHGRLDVTVFNTSKNCICIDPTLPFCCIFFQTLERPLSDELPERVPPEPKIINNNRFISWLYSVVPNMITIGLSVGMTFLIAFLLGWFGR